LPKPPAPKCNASRNPERRTFLKLSGLAALGAGLGTLASRAGSEPTYALSIRTARVELAPGHCLSTLTYNGRPVGPLIRARAGRLLRIDVHNQTDASQWIHWHAQNVPHGGSRVAARSIRRIHFIPERPGLFFYHSGQVAAANLEAGLYSGQVGALLIESSARSAHQRVLVLKDFEPTLRRARQGFELDYGSLTINGHLHDTAPPQIPVGHPVLVHVLNASATRTLGLTIPGHSFHVAALDGNPVSSPASLSRLILHPGERISAWLKLRRAGPCIVFPAAGETLDYSLFGSRAAPAPDAIHELVLVCREAARSGFNRWSINEASLPTGAIEPLLQVTTGRRYRLRIRNTSEEILPLHLQRHRMEVITVAGVAIGGVVKDVVAVGPHQVVEVDFIADSPGPAELYCTRQLQRDFGLRALVRYRGMQESVSYTLEECARATA
jgi:FtsP/CotA-like multicopper oxidase with cupredoxin domain